MRRSLAALALAVVLPLPSLAPAAALANVVVKPGETLSEIADRHGVSLNRLMQANGITNPNLVVAGQTLVLPGGRNSAGAAGGGSRGGSVTVQSGETLSEIADRQGVSLTRLMQANGITNPNMVVAGQTLVLPGGRSAASATAPRPLPTAPYTVKSGETLSEIADRFGTSTDRLIQLNRISNPNMVVAGTRLAIPGRPSSAPAAASASTPRTATARHAKEHTVRSGESLSTIADTYGLPIEKLVAINKIEDPDLVVSGTRLKLQAPPPVKAPVKAAVKAPVKTAAKAPVKAPVQAAAPAPTMAAAKPVAVAKPVAAAKPVTQPQPKPATATATAAAPAPVAMPAAKATATLQPTPRAEPALRPQPTATATQAMALAQPATNTIKPTGSIAAATTGITPTTGLAATKTTAATAATATTTATTAARTATRATTTRLTDTSKTATSKAGSSKPQGPDWRSYGPLQVDWANWQPMGGSYVAPTLNGDGKPVYLAVNCGARKLNATSQSGQWKSWDAPQTDFEEQLISDICKARAS